MGLNYKLLLGRLEESQIFLAKILKNCTTLKAVVVGKILLWLVKRKTAEERPVFSGALECQKYGGGKIGGHNLHPELESLG